MGNLLDRCVALTEQINGDPKWVELISKVAQEYAAPGRVYHDIRHVNRLFDELDRWRCELKLPARRMVALELAIIYHDVVYVPGRADNESLSADRAVADLRSLNVDRGTIRSVKKAILATVHHVCSRHDRIAQLLIDLDLCAMANPKEYVENGSRIRQEFSIYDDREYAQGRADFLHAMICRRRIFRGPFAKRYEAAARANILADIERHTQRL